MLLSISPGGVDPPIPPARISVLHPGEQSKAISRAHIEHGFMVKISPVTFMLVY